MIDVYPLLEEKGGIKRFSKCDYDSLLERADTPSLANTTISNMMMCILKCINFINYPEYLKEVFQFSTTDYSLRGTNVLVLPKTQTPTYSLNSVRNAASGRGVGKGTSL